MNTREQFVALKASGKLPSPNGTAMKLIELDFFEGPWVMGEQYTVADAYLFTIEGWLKGDGVDIDDLPIIKDHHERMSARPAVQRAYAPI